MKRLPLVLSILASMAAAVWAYQYANHWAGLDFYQFWAGSQLARRPAITNLYSMETRRGAPAEFMRRSEGSQRMRLVAEARREFEFYSTPFLYACFGAFSSDYDVALRTYGILVIVAAAAGVIVIARRSGLAWTQTLFILAFVLLLYEPFKSDLRVGNVNSFQLAGIALALAVAPLRGFVLGLLVAFKPNVIFIVPVLIAYRLVRKEWRQVAIEAAGVLVGLVAAVATGAAYFRSMTAWRQWLAAARELASNSRPFSEGNIAPLQLLATTFGAPVAYAVILVAAGVSIYLMWQFTRREKHDATLLMIGAALLMYIITASLVWVHYLVLLLPVIIALMAEAGAVMRRIAAGAGFAFLAGTAWNPETPVGEARLYWTGIAIVFIAFLWRLTERARSDVQPRRRRRS